MKDQIKEKIDIVELISEYLPLKRVGKYYRGLCPFHSEKNPSFYVSPERQMFHCFGCGASGDIFTFLMKMENLEFFEALKILAERAGVEIERQDPAVKQEKNELLELNNVVADFYHQQLKNFPEGLEYLFQRGLNQETIEKFRLGFAKEKNNLYNYLLKFGFPPNLIEKSGLFILEKGVRERFRNRIIFPIWDHLNRLVGFGGRIFGQENPNIPKYINTPETSLYKKAQVLYGLQVSLKWLKDSKTAILLEGYLDFLMAWQKGLKNIVAICGTSLTEDHIQLLKRYVEKIIIGFDRDEAGERNTVRANFLILQKGLQTERLIFQSAKDLAEYFEQGFKKEDLKTENLIQYLFEQGQKIFELDKVEERQRFLEYFLPHLVYLKTAEKDFWLKKTSQLLKITLPLVEDEFKKIEANILKTESFELKEEPLSEKDNKNLIFERILALIALTENKSALQKIKNILPEKDLVKDLEIYLKTKKINSDELMKILLRAEYEKENIDNIEEELNWLIRQLKIKSLKFKIQEAKEKLFHFENFKDRQKILNQIKLYSEELKNLLKSNAQKES